MNKIEKGITMVTLVVTIAVLLIIIGVTVARLTSEEDGLFQSTENEIDYQQESVVNEERKMNETMQSQFNDWGF